MAAVSLRLWLAFWSEPRRRSGAHGNAPLPHWSEARADRHRTLGHGVLYILPEGGQPRVARIAKAVGRGDIVRTSPES